MVIKVPVKNSSPSCNGIAPPTRLSLHRSRIHPFKDASIRFLAISTDKNGAPHRRFVWMKSNLVS
jgi:hypothetical protein